jgi:hypothetical protein
MAPILQLGGVRSMQRTVGSPWDGTLDRGQGNGGIAPLVIGGFCVWHGLAERERGVRNKPLWPTLLWLTILVAIGVVLYLLAPPLAFLYAIVVGVIVRFSLLASWITRE